MYVLYNRAFAPGVFIMFQQYDFWESNNASTFDPLTRRMQDFTICQRKHIFWIAKNALLYYMHAYAFKYLKFYLPDTVLVLIKLTKYAVALWLRCGSCKLIFFTLFHHVSLNLRTLNIVWSLVRRRVSRRLTRLQTMCNVLKYRKIF